MRVCVVGDGLSALTLAKAIVNQNICVDIYAQKKAKSINQTRTIGISKNNSDFFNNNIINIKKLLWKLNKIEIFTENLKNEKLLNFENKNDQLFSIIKNHELYKVLEKDLSKSKYFKKFIVKKDSLSFINNYDLIINCDYAHAITKKYFSKKIIKKYNSYAYTVLIEHNKIPNNVATQIFTKRGPLAFLPLSNNETSIVYSIYNSKSEEKENISDLISHYNFKYKIKKISKINKFELKSSILRSYYHKNILAFGDLLHKIHPLAGQGFNMTIRDIEILTQIIKVKLSLGLPLDETINYEFEKRTRHKNTIFSNGIDLIYELFNLERKIKNDTLSKSIKVLGKNLSINKIFTRFADKGIMF